MIKKIDVLLILLTLLIFIIFNNNSINVTNDSINYIQNSLLINSYIYNLNIIFEKVTYYPLLYSLVLSFFLSEQNTVDAVSCLDTIDQCVVYFEHVMILQIVVFFTTAIIIFLISQKLFNNRIISYASTILFLCNSYYLSRVFFISPEVFAIFFFTITFYFWIIFIEKKNNKYFLLLIFFSVLLITIKPIFIIIDLFLFCYLFYYKIFDYKKFIFSILIILFFFSFSSFIKEKLFKKNNYGYELTVIEQRTAYGFIEYKEILPLFISFIPKFGNYYLEKIFDEKQIYRVKSSENSRNYFYNNRDKLNKKNKDNLSNKEILIINLKNLDKQIILTPVFLFRGMFMQGGYSDFYINKKNFITSVLIYFNYSFFSFAKFYLLYIGFKSMFSKEKKYFQLILFYPLIVFLCHSVLTHNLPRYTSILFGIAAVFMFQKIYNLLINYYKKNNV